MHILFEVRTPPAGLGSIGLYPGTFSGERTTATFVYRVISAAFR